jgi:hypothetical protein
MCFLLESWIREKRLIWAKADGLKIGTIGFFLLRVIVYRKGMEERVKGRRTNYFLGLGTLTTVCSLPPVALIS